MTRGALVVLADVASKKAKENGAPSGAPQPFTAYLSERLKDLEAAWKLEPERLLLIRMAIQREIDGAEGVIADAGGGTAGLMRILRGDSGEVPKMALDQHLDRAERMLSAAKKEHQDRTVLQPLANLGKKRREQQAEFGRRRGSEMKSVAADEHKRWQAEATRVWAAHPNWKKLAVATQVVENLTLGHKPDTVSRKIKKP